METTAFVVTVLKEVITALAALAAVFIAYKGLNIWRVQLHATADNELARKILVGLYKINLGYYSIRRPFREAFIPHEKQNDPNATEEAYSKQYQDEWEKLSAERVDLQVACIEAQALWHRDFLNHLMPLNGFLGEFEDHLRDYLRAKSGRTKDLMYEPAEIRKAVFGMQGSKSDEFGKRFDKIIFDFDTVVRAKFQR